MNSQITLKINPFHFAPCTLNPSLIEQKIFEIQHIENLNTEKNNLKVTMTIKGKKRLNTRCERTDYFPFFPDRPFYRWMNFTNVGKCVCVCVGEQWTKIRCGIETNGNRPAILSRSLFLYNVHLSIWIEVDERNFYWNFNGKQFLLSLQLLLDERFRQ